MDPCWTISFHLDERPAGAAHTFPAHFPLDITALKGPNPKHVLWVGILDAEGKTVGGAEHIFKLPGAVW